MFVRGKKGHAPFLISWLLHVNMGNNFATSTSSFWSIPDILPCYQKAKILKLFQSEPYLHSDICH